MTRVLTGDVLVNEDERLQARMNQFAERIEMAFRQALRIAASQGQLRGIQSPPVLPPCAIWYWAAGCVSPKPVSSIRWQTMPHCRSLLLH
jgi:hypothetical protein